MKGMGKDGRYGRTRTGAPSRAPFVCPSREVLSFGDGLDSRDRPFTARWIERAGVFLAGQDVRLGIRLPA